VTSATVHAAFAPSPRHLRPGDTTRVHASRHVRTRHTRVVRTAAWASSSRQPWVVLASSSSSSSSSNDGHDRFAYVRPGIDPDPRRRADIQIGSDVDVIRKEDQASGSTTRGVVREFLTNSATHPQGLKVRLVDGTIGRVARVHAGKTEVASSSPGGAESADTSEKKNGEDERARRGASQKPKEARGASSGGDASSKAKNNSNASSRNTDSNQTVYLSNIPKALGKKDVAWLLEELSGVTGVRLPRRGGKNMGYAFVLTQDIQSANTVIDALGGMELEGKKLLAELAKEPTRESNPGRKNEGAKAADKKKKGGSNTDKANDKRRNDKRNKNKATMNDDDDDDEEEPLSDPIAIDRAEMEADAILQLERAKRAAAKRAAEADAIAKERLQREAALEAKTTAMLLERRRQAEAREARIAIEKARERAILDEAEALGAPAVGEDWTRTSVELREELSSLRSQSGA